MNIIIKRCHSVRLHGDVCDVIQESEVRFAIATVLNECHEILPLVIKSLNKEQLPKQPINNLNFPNKLIKNRMNIEVYAVKELGRALNKKAKVSDIAAKLVSITLDHLSAEIADVAFAHSRRVQGAAFGDTVTVERIHVRDALLGDPAYSQKQV